MSTAPMTASSNQRPLLGRFSVSSLISRLRLISGLILFAYVTGHLINHIAGLWSIEALEQMRRTLSPIWQTEIGGAALYGGGILHVMIALRAIYLRDSLRAMSSAEVGQMVLGLILPVLLITHVIGTDYLGDNHGVNVDYTFVLLAIWVFDPMLAYQQALALIVAWGHGCVGLHLWLRFKGWYNALWPWLLGLAVLIPGLSMAGFIAGGREIEQLAEDKDWLNLYLGSANLPSQETLNSVLMMIDRITVAMVVVVAFTFLARQVRLIIKRRRQNVTINYGSGRKVVASKGMSILDVSRANSIPHAAVCGGRGRCSTCRVRIGDGLEALNEPSDLEVKVLSRISAPPNVRLACQTEAVNGIEVTPLMPPHASVKDSKSGPSYLQGRELDIAVLFADIRGFTQLSEERLPYDVVFILNRYFAEMGSAIEQSGGRVDKFIGDGVMALFGVDGNAELGAKQAIKAAKAMSERLKDLNASLAGDLSEPLRIGIGIHAGPAIVGEMGFGNALGVTAVGDTVNTASRVEALTKEFKCQLILSQSTLAMAGLELGELPREEIDIRGRNERLTIHLVEDASTLALEG